MTIVRVTTFIRDGKDELMGVNDSGLKRTTTKDAQLQNKLIAARKKRDGVADKTLRLGKKKKLTSGDVQRLSQHKKDLLKYEKEITKLTDEISKNNVHIQRYKEGLTKEQKKQFLIQGCLSLQLYLYVPGQCRYLWKVPILIPYQYLWL